MTIITVITIIFFYLLPSTFYFALDKKYDMYIICIDLHLARQNMTDKLQNKLRNQLKTLQRLGLPPDKSFLSLLSNSTHSAKKTEKAIEEQNVRV